MQQQIKHLIQKALQALQQQNKIPDNITWKINVEPTKNSAHGDFTSNIALQLAKELQCKPMDIAQAIAACLPQQNSLVEQTTVAPPGFINFKLTDNAFHDIIANVLQQKEKFGYQEYGKGKTIMVEFVSSNPTGPLHVGHGRGAAFGASVADLVETMGYKVHREYYVNDAGRQMRVLALSIWLRYIELDMELPHFPASGYHGTYVKDIAIRFKVENGEKFIRPLPQLFENLPIDAKDGGDKEFYVDALIERAVNILGENDFNTILQAGLEAMIADMREDLEEFGVVFDEWFYESGLLKNGDVQKGIDLLTSHGHTYNQDGALWFKATNFGDEKDRVLIRTNGQPTYFASDVGYHLNKYERGFDKIIDIFGSDHHGYAPRVKGFLKALQLDPNKLEILLVQFAILYRGKEKVPMSTRAGEFVTLRTLREEVGNDAARFFYIMRKSDQHLDFDLELAKSQSAANPVYYIQYAHARIASVLRQAQDKNITSDLSIGLEHLHLLSTEHEKNLLRQIARYPIVLQNAAENYEPHTLAYYLRELANDFHTYYNAHQFLIDNQTLCQARLCLIQAVKQLIFNGLTLLGVSSPESM
jgi:arginyl-tRNA synthetase